MIQNALINIFDIIIILLLVIINYIYWKNKYSRFCLFFFLCILFYGLIFPLISIEVEFILYGPKKDEIFDAFTMAYVYLKFPFYWILFVLQLIILRLNKNNFIDDTV